MVLRRRCNLNGGSTHSLELVILPLAAAGPLALCEPERVQVHFRYHEVKPSKLKGTGRTGEVGALPRIGMRGGYARAACRSVKGMCIK